MYDKLFLSIKILGLGKYFIVREKEFAVRFFFVVRRIKRIRQRKIFPCVRNQRLGKVLFSVVSE
jgi:hypothetical protein